VVVGIDPGIKRLEISWQYIPEEGKDLIAEGWNIVGSQRHIDVSY
jgi:hypothetical protein